MLRKNKSFLFFKTGLLLFFLVFIINKSYSENKSFYLWPMKIFNGLSGTFQEYRGGHFHGGLDIKTFKKTGYPVYALTDGEVYKIRVVRRGGGRGIYFKHKDGNISIFYHLERYEPRLENILKKVQKVKGKKYIGNYYLKKKIKYKRGDILALSGETGVGFPHLHFELRDNKYYAINPFPFLKYPGKDDKLPIFKTVFFKPIKDATINGKRDKVSSKFYKKKYGHYELSKPVVFTGSFDLTVNTYDINDSGHRVAPYRIIAYIDGNPYFEIINDRFKRDDNNQLGFAFDLFHTNSSNYFYNIYFQKGFELERRKINFSQVYKELSFGNHSLKIKTVDYFNNYSVGIIPFIKMKKPEINLNKIILEKDSIVLDIKKIDCKGSDGLEIILADERLKTLYKGILNTENEIVDRKLRLKAHDDLSKFLIFKVIKKGMVIINKKYSLSDDEWKENIDVDFDTFVNRDNIYLKIKNERLTAENLNLEIIQGRDRYGVFAKNDANGISFILEPVNMTTDVRLIFSLKKGDFVYSKIQKYLKIIPLKSGEYQSFKWDEFEAEFAVNTVKEKRLLLVKKVYHKSYFPVLSQEFDLSPYCFPFLDTVNYKIKKKVDHPKQVGIFKYNHFRKKWGSVYTRYNNKTKTFSVRIRSSGTFALMRDIFSPKIKFYKPKRIRREKLNFLTVILTDRGKGINHLSIKIKLNGKIIKDEFDPDRSSVRITELNHLKSGKNILTVKVSDYAGNTAEREYKFYLY